MFQYATKMNSFQRVQQLVLEFVIVESNVLKAVFVKMITFSIRKMEHVSQKTIVLNIPKRTFDPLMLEQ
jgi:hypothetical protein